MQSGTLSDICPEAHLTTEVQIHSFSHKSNNKRKAKKPREKGKKIFVGVFQSAEKYDVSR